MRPILGCSRPWPVSWTDSSLRSCGNASSRCSHRHHPAPRGGVPRQVPDRNCAAALVFMARTSTPWARCCQLKSWAAARRPPAGGGWTSGPARGCSSSSRHCCWMNWGRPGGSTLSGSASTLSACGRSKGGPDRRQSHRSGQGRVQAAPGRQARWAAAGTDPERGQRQRLDHAGGGAGGHPGDPHAHRPPGGVVLARCMPTRPTITAAAAAICVGEGSSPGSPAAGLTPQPGLAATVGRSSGPGPGWADGDGYGSAMSGPPNASTPWPCWPVR